MHLYFIGNKDYVKVGVTSNPSQREKSIQTMCPFEIKLLKLVANQGELEKELHSALMNLGLHTTNEWFRNEGLLRGILLNKETVKDVISKSKERKALCIGENFMFFSDIYNKQMITKQSLLKKLKEIYFPYTYFGKKMIIKESNLQEFYKVSVA